MRRAPSWLKKKRPGAGAGALPIVAYTGTQDVRGVAVTT
jgi:hypothetical protein